MQPLLVGSPPLDEGDLALEDPARSGKAEQSFRVRNCASLNGLSLQQRDRLWEIDDAYLTPWPHNSRYKMVIEHR